MRRFTFPLEGLLKIRHHHERERELELGHITARYERLLNHIAAIEQERHATAVGIGGVDLSMRLSQTAYLELLDRSAGELEERREELAGLRQQALEAYTAALRERKVIDNLKTRRAEEHFKREARRSERELNEIGSLGSPMRHFQEGQHG